VTKRFFRAHREPNLEVGTVIRSPGDHIKDLKGNQLLTENLLRENAPAGHEKTRSELLYVFDDLYLCEVYFLGRKTSTVYEVAIDPADVVHTADIDLFNDIAKDPANAEHVNPLLKAYWDGETRSGKKVEYLVRQVRIVDTIWRPSDYGKVRAKLISGRLPDNSFYDIKNPKDE
jgi:hypothetical protein